jgi:regulatory protein
MKQKKEPKNQCTKGIDILPIMGDFEKSFDDAQDKFYNKALRFLSYRPRSEEEIRKYLRHSRPDRSSTRSRTDSRFREDDTIDIIEKVIAKLKEQKFLNDGEFAKWWIESRLRFRPRSINLIKRELLQKGVDRDLIDAQISNLKSQISNELENAQKLIEKKIKRYRNLSKQEIYQKLGSYLARRGFDWETIKKSIDEVLSQGV